MYGVASKLYNEMLGIYFDEYYDFEILKEKRWTLNITLNLMLDTHNYTEWFKKR